MKEGPTIFYHDGCMIQAPHGCFYYWTRGALSRGILNTPLHSRLNKNTLFSVCCCTIRWIATKLSRINTKLLLPLLLVPIMSVVPIMPVVPFMSLYLSLFQSCRAIHHILLLWLATLSDMMHHWYLCYSILLLHFQHDSRPQYYYSLLCYHADSATPRPKTTLSQGS